MSHEICERCQIVMVQSTNDSSEWSCPTCGQSVLSLYVESRIELATGLGVHSESRERVGDLPQQEFCEAANPKGPSSGTTIERRSDSSLVQRWLKPDAPKRRDPKGTVKRKEEEAAVRALLRRYNEAHQTNYDTVESGQLEDDAHGDDVEMSDSSGRDKPIWCQVVFVDPDENLYAQRARGDQYQSESTEDQLIERFCEQLNDKVRKAPDRNQILILDGSSVMTPVGVIERFAKRYETELATAPFREVGGSTTTSGESLSD